MHDIVNNLGMQDVDSAKVWRGGPIMRGAVCETGFLYAWASG